MWGSLGQEDKDQSVWLFIVVSLVPFEESRLHPLGSRESLERSKQVWKRTGFVVCKTDRPDGASVEDGLQRGQGRKCESGEMERGEGARPLGV